MKEDNITIKHTSYQ